MDSKHSIPSLYNGIQHEAEYSHNEVQNILWDVD